MALEAKKKRSAHCLNNSVFFFTDDVRQASLQVMLAFIQLASISLHLLFIKLIRATNHRSGTSDFLLTVCSQNPVWSCSHHKIYIFIFFLSHQPTLSPFPSLYPDGVVAILSARVRGRAAAGRREVAERGEELLHLLLQHLVPPLGVVLGPLGVAQLDLGHGVLLPLLVQLLVQAHHLRLQLHVTLLQAAEGVGVQG